MMKTILLPVAAFAVTATSASAFSGDMLNKLDLDLTDSQVAALEEVHELREAGDVDRAAVKEILEDADIDRETMRDIRQAIREYRAGVRADVKAAIEAEDFDAYQDAVADTKRDGVIETEADFAQLIEANELREAGDREGARAILEELGFEKPEGKKRGHGFGPRGEFNQN